jgi:hypothetical protein
VTLRLLSALPCIPFVIALGGGAVGCGETKGNPAAAGGKSDGGTAGAASAGGNAGNAEGGAVSEATYAGAVLAMLTEREGATTYVARAVFTNGPRPTIGGCPRCCCNRTDRGLPLPDKPPDASVITVQSASGPPALATLVPEVFEDGRGIFHGMSDLGWAWFAPLSDYAAVTSQPWDAGDTLQVLAEGNEVAPFSGLLHVGAAIAGLTPPLGSTPVIVDHTRAFEISWTPEGNGDATVLLGIPTGSGICYCDAPDAAGRLVVAAELLSPVSGEISLARLTVSNVASSNASVDLVGAVIQKGPLEVH